MAGTTSQTLTNCHVYRPRRDAAARLRALLRVWRGRVQQRAELTRLDFAGLRDIGLSAADANREAAKWFWQE